MTRAWTVAAALALSAAMGATANSETIVKTGKTSSGDRCTVSVEKHADGSISAVGAAGSSSSAGSISSSSSAGSTGVNVQAGGGSVSSSMTTGGPGSVSASTMTVNGCTISTTSP